MTTTKKPRPKARMKICPTCGKRFPQLQDDPADICSACDPGDKTMTTTYRIDLDALTVIAIDEHGTENDLNAEGEPCQSLEDLRQFVIELREQGLPGWTAGLLAEIDDEQTLTRAVRSASDALQHFAAETKVEAVASELAYQSPEVQEENLRRHLDALRQLARRQLARDDEARTS